MVPIGIGGKRKVYLRRWVIENVSIPNRRRIREYVHFLARKREKKEERDCEIKRVRYLWHWRLILEYFQNVAKKKLPKLKRESKTCLRLPYWR